ncbi:MAG: Rpn family recombination-promoting nuclease/putative transposase [Ottowia sp.]|nr:Rpn family recombination-promoting nuclease/putative transposase [Ottowia sp.]
MSKRPSREQILAHLQHMRLADNIFMGAFFRHNVDSAQFVLRIIMDKPGLVVQEVRSQDYQPNPGWRAATLDVLATDADGRLINVEVQLDPRGASAQRARFHASLMDSNALLPGQSFDELPEVWVIFITEGDVLGGGKPIYHFVRHDKDGAFDLGDGSHIIYVGSEHQQAGTALGDLMHDFFCRDVAHMRLAQLAQAVQRFKTSEQGAREMNSVIDEIREELREDLREELREDMREEVREEVREEALTEGRAEGRMEGSRDIARQLLRMEGFTPEVVARITSLSVDEVQRLGAEAGGA